MRIDAERIQRKLENEYRSIKDAEFDNLHKQIYSSMIGHALGRDSNGNYFNLSRQAAEDFIKNKNSQKEAK